MRHRQLHRLFDLIKEIIEALSAAASERRGEHLIGLRGFYLKATARIWHWMFYMCHTRSTAVTPDRVKRHHQKDRHTLKRQAKHARTKLRVRHRQLHRLFDLIHVHDSISWPGDDERKLLSILLPTNTITHMPFYHYQTYFRK